MLELMLAVFHLCLSCLLYVLLQEDLQLGSALSPIHSEGDMEEGESALYAAQNNKHEHISQVEVVCIGINYKQCRSRTYALLLWATIPVALLLRGWCCLHNRFTPVSNMYLHAACFCLGACHKISILLAVLKLSLR